MKPSTLYLYLFAGLTPFLVAPSRLDAAIVIGGPVVNPATNNRYYLLSMDTWDASQAAAVQLGGSLATINDEEEQVWVFSIFGNFGGVVRNLWIGLNDKIEEGNFQWADGSKAAYRNWAASEPNDLNGIEDCVQIVHPSSVQAGKWNDLPSVFTTADDRPIFGVVEVPPVNVSIELAVAVRWLAVQGQLYQVQWASELTGNMWLPFGQLVTGNGQINTTFDLTAGQERRFYRVVEAQ